MHQLQPSFSCVFHLDLLPLLLLLFCHRLTSDPWCWFPAEGVGDCTDCTVWSVTRQNRLSSSKRLSVSLPLISLSLSQHLPALSSLYVCLSRRLGAIEELEWWFLTTNTLMWRLCVRQKAYLFLYHERGLSGLKSLQRFKSVWYIRAPVFCEIHNEIELFFYMAKVEDCRALLAVH